MICRDPSDIIEVDGVYYVTDKPEKWSAKGRVVPFVKLTELKVLAQLPARFLVQTGVDWLLQVLVKCW